MILGNGRAIFHEKRAERSPHGTRNRDPESFGQPNVFQSHGNECQAVSGNWCRTTDRKRWSSKPGNREALIGEHEFQGFRETGIPESSGKPELQGASGNRGSGKSRVTGTFLSAV